MNNKLTIDELNFLKDLITKLDEDNKVFSLSSEIIEAKSKQLKSNTKEEIPIKKHDFDYSKNE